MRWIDEGTKRDETKDERSQRGKVRRNTRAESCDDWMGGLPRASSIFPWATFSCCRPPDCLYSIKILLFLTCAGWEDIDEAAQSSRWRVAEKWSRSLRVATLPLWVSFAKRISRGVGFVDLTPERTSGLFRPVVYSQYIVFLQLDPLNGTTGSFCISSVFSMHEKVKNATYVHFENFSIANEVTK